MTKLNDKETDRHEFMISNTNKLTKYKPYRNYDFFLLPVYFIVGVGDGLCLLILIVGRLLFRLSNFCEGRRDVLFDAFFDLVNTTESRGEQNANTFKTDGRPLAGVEVRENSHNPTAQFSGGIAPPNSPPVQTITTSSK
jgi:hypothetical protein